MRGTRSPTERGSYRELTPRSSTELSGDEGPLYRSGKPLTRSFSRCQAIEQGSMRTVREPAEQTPRHRPPASQRKGRTMTRHTSTAATDTRRHRRTTRVGSSFRLLVTGIVLATLSLTVWTALQAQAMERRIGAASYPAPHTPVRQLERDVEERTEELRRLDEVEVQRFANRSGFASHSEGMTDPSLLQMEHDQLRRLRNRAPDWALPALDAEIERLREAFADSTPGTSTGS